MISNTSYSLTLPTVVADIPLVNAGSDLKTAHRTDATGAPSERGIIDTVRELSGDTTRKLLKCQRYYSVTDALLGRVIPVTVTANLSFAFSAKYATLEMIKDTAAMLLTFCLSKSDDSQEHVNLIRNLWQGEQ